MGCGDVLGSSYVLHRAWRKNAAIIMKLGMEKKQVNFLDMLSEPSFFAFILL